MGRMDWKLKLASVLIILSLIAYLTSYLIFGDAKDELFWFVESLAFLPIEVLLVTVIIDSVLTRQERRQKLEKMSMVTDAFFSEIGSNLISQFLTFDRNAGAIRGKLNVAQGWSEQDYIAARKSLGSHRFDIYCRQSDLGKLRDLLVAKRDFLLRLLENPNLLEHESFTEMLRATFHLIDELISRKNLNTLSQADTDHLSNDMNRAYAALVGQWIEYMLHLKRDYPYLYSLAARVNPFNPNASAEIQ